MSVSDTSYVTSGSNTKKSAYFPTSKLPLKLLIPSIYAGLYDNT
jgi:hypothetical protein